MIKYFVWIGLIIIDMNKGTIITGAVFLILIIGVLNAPQEDLVSFPVSGYLGKWYSGKLFFIIGYLNFTTGQFHYVFF
jgi:hypothetical protein